MFISVNQAEISNWKNNVTDLKSRRSEEDDISDMTIDWSFDQPALLPGSYGKHQTLKLMSLLTSASFVLGISAD